MELICRVNGQFDQYIWIVDQCIKHLIIAYNGSLEGLAQLSLSTLILVLYKVLIVLKAKETKKCRHVMSCHVMSSHVMMMMMIIMCCSSAIQSHAFDEGIMAWHVISKQILLRV
jgi:hypothetical protein